MGISRGKSHKRSATGAKRKQCRKKRKFELGRQPANTKLGAQRIRQIRSRGGNYKYRALRLDHGNFSLGSEAITKKTRIVAVVYNATSNELVRTNTLVKSAIVQIDAAPFRPVVEKLLEKTSDSTGISKARKLLEEQVSAGRLYAIITSRPGQVGCCNGYILEGEELEFYLRKIKSKK